MSEERSPKAEAPKDEQQPEPPAGEATGAPKKRPYKTPKLNYLGTTFDLTKGIGGASPDGTSNTKVTGQ